VGNGNPPAGGSAALTLQQANTELLLFRMLPMPTVENTLPVTTWFGPSVLLEVEFPPVLKLPPTLFSKSVWFL
jgi:hypothetical protein